MFLTFIITKTSLSAKINDVKGKIPTITINLATTTTVRTTVEIKTSNVSNLVR